MAYKVQMFGNGLAVTDHKNKTIVLGSEWQKLPYFDKQLIYLHEIWHTIDGNRTYGISDEIEADIYAIKTMHKKHGLDYLHLFKRLAYLLKGKNQEGRLNSVAKELKIKYLDYGY